MKCLLAFSIMSLAQGAAEPRKRLRELGIVIGALPPGKHNAITDVAGVRVGHVTLVRGDAVRTGVTAILPHGGDLWNEKVPAGRWVQNGAGEMTGSIWIDTLGALEVPILLTNTMSVGQVMDGVVRYMLGRYPLIGAGDQVVAPTVAECDDSSLNDARGLHVSAADAVRAITSAQGGPVAEGAVGAGTGMIAFELKAGIGTASRVLSKAQGGFTVGVLVNANMDLRANLRVDGVPIGREIVDLMPKAKAREGSIIGVVATDAPLDALRLERLASKAAIGMARTGASARNGSGDLFIAFSTGNRVPHRARDTTYPLRVVADELLNPLFQAVEEATEEAILNALCMAETTTGRDGYVAHALPLERLVTLMRQYGRR